MSYGKCGMKIRLTPPIIPGTHNPKAMPKEKPVPVADVPIKSDSSILSPGGRAAARIALALAKRVEDQSR
jgi:hypothetical protein